MNTYMKTKSCHDANFVFVSGTVGCDTDKTTSGAIGDDIVDMTILWRHTWKLRIISVI